MTLSRIISSRIFQNGFPMQIVYEWEDEIAQALGLSFVYNYTSLRCVNHTIRKCFPALRLPAPTKQNAICFVLEPECWDYNIAGKENIIPVLIDFWYRDVDSLKKFDLRYSNNPLVLVTSAEAYQVIKANCPHVRAVHWALSIPTQYSNLGECNTSNRRYDCIMIGRPNKILSEWTKRYSDTHKDFVYVQNSRTKKHMNWYVASSGEVLGDVIRTREAYFSLMKSAKIGLYSTPSMDNSRVTGNGFNQVTPRFLEYLSAGCHVVARYPKNEDTDFFSMNEISPHVETYVEFERKIDEYRTKEIDVEMYERYLMRHSTNTRMNELKKILERLP